MRQLASFLLLLLVLPASATQAWRWKDADGVVHYSDSPVPGAERIELRGAQKTGSSATPEPGPPAPAQEQAEPVAAPYQRCAISMPANNEVFNSVDSVTALVDLEPALQPGHRVQVFLNGQIYPDWPEGVLTYTLTNLFRGSYALNVRVVDQNGRMICLGPSITFHVRQPSVLAPGRRKPGG